MAPAIWWTLLALALGLIAWWMRRRLHVWINQPLRGDETPLRSIGYLLGTLVWAWLGLTAACILAAQLLGLILTL